MSGSDIAPTSAPSANAAHEHSILQNLLPHLLRLLRREPALVITTGYLLVALAGIYYNESFYSKFGIPVLTLSQIGDFLVAGVQQPMAPLLVLSTLPIVWLIDLFNSRLRTRQIASLARLRALPHPTTWQRWWMRILIRRIHQYWWRRFAYVVVVVVYGWLFVHLYAEYRAEEVKEGAGLHVNVWINGATDPLPAKSPSWTYLGAASSYVFLFDHDAGRVQIVPVNSIVRIEPASAIPKSKP